MKRGEIYFANLSETTGSEQGGMRPVLIIQNDIGNRYSPTVIVAAITGQIQKGKLPTHIEIGKEDGIKRDSVILLEQIRTIDKSRLSDKMVTYLSKEKMAEVDRAVLVSLGMMQKVTA